MNEFKDGGKSNCTDFSLFSDFSLSWVRLKHRNYLGLPTLGGFIVTMEQRRWTQMQETAGEKFSG